MVKLYVGFYLEKELFKKFRKRCLEKGLKMSQVVNDLVDEWARKGEGREEDKRRRKGGEEGFLNWNFSIEEDTLMRFRRKCSQESLKFSRVISRLIGEWLKKEELES